MAEKSHTRLNLHRPCMFSTSKVDPKGKIIKVYKHKDVKTPLEALEMLDKQGLVKFKKETTMSDLKAQSMRQTDLAAAQEMQHAKGELFASFRVPKNSV